MSYIDDLADAIRAGVAPDLIPDGNVDQLFRIYAVLALSKGDRVAIEDVHDAWSAWMAGQDPAHPSLRPLNELPSGMRESDRPFLEAIRAVARQR